MAKTYRDFNIGGLSVLHYLSGWSFEWKYFMDRYGVKYDRITDTYLYLNKEITNDEIIAIDADKMPSGLEWVNDIATKQGNWIGLEHYMDTIIRYQLNLIRDYWNLWSIESEESFINAELVEQYRTLEIEHQKQIKEQQILKEELMIPMKVITSMQADKVLNNTIAGIKKHEDNLLPFSIILSSILLILIFKK